MSADQAGIEYSTHGTGRMWEFRQGWWQASHSTVRVGMKETDKAPSRGSTGAHAFGSLKLGRLQDTILCFE